MVDLDICSGWGRSRLCRYDICRCTGGRIQVASLAVRGEGGGRARMSLSARRSGRTGIAIIAALVFGAVLCAGAEAAGNDCPAQDASQTFLPWSDPAWYVLAPNGGFEDGASGWTLSGGAAVQDGNETYQVGGTGDAHSLALGDGAAAKTARICIDVAHPTIRLFARNQGSSSGRLRISVLYRGLLGIWLSLPIGAVSAGSGWAPTAAIPVVVNLLSLLDDSEAVFRFEAD